MRYTSWVLLRVVTLVAVLLEVVNPGSDSIDWSWGQDGGSHCEATQYCPTIGSAGLWPER